MKKLLFIIIGVSGTLAATAQKQAAQAQNKMTADTIQVEVKSAYTVYSEEENLGGCSATRLVLVKEAARVGSTFKTDTSKVLSILGHTSYQCTPPEWEYYDKQIIVKQPCNGKPKTVTVKAQRIKTPSAYKTVKIPTTYRLRTQSVVVKMGDGELISAEYKVEICPQTYTRMRLRAKLIPAEYKTVVVQKCNGE
jgi:hypothetical protein